jgi:CMP-N-acetylneuraminic acid synthetase
VGLDFADQIMASTDSTEIGKVAAASGPDFWFLRPVELATDSASKISPGYYECQSASFWVG